MHLTDDERRLIEARRRHAAQYAHAFDERGVLKNGARITIPVAFRDSAAGSPLKIALVPPPSIRDAFAGVPDLRQKALYIDGMLRSTSRTEVESGLRGAYDLLGHLRLAMDGVPGRLTADADRAGAARASAALADAIASAQQRLTDESLN